MSSKEVIYFWNIDLGSSAEGEDLTDKKELVSKMKEDYGYTSEQNGPCTTTLTDSGEKDQEFKIIIKQNEHNQNYIDVEITQNFKVKNWSEKF